MHFTGLPLTTLSAIGAAAALAIALLYVLKLRRRPVAVPFARIWERVLRDKDATTLFSRLKRVLSLLLQLALLALLVLALGDPRAAASELHGRSVVVLVDASASMKAIDVATTLEPGRTRLDDARDEVKKLVRGLGGSDRMLVAQMDAVVTPVSTMTGDAAELEASLPRVAATDARADFPRALRFASDVLRGQPSPEVVVVSDGVLGEARDAAGKVELDGAKLSFVPIGKRGRNVAITELTVRRYPLDRDRYEVMIELTNTSAEPEQVELSLFGDGNVVDVTRLRLGPNERLPRFYPNLSGAKKTLEATLKLADGGHDDLPADDHAYALLPSPRHVRLLCVTAGNMYLEAALLLASFLDVTYLAPSAYPPKEGTFDVTIFDGVAPKLAPGAGSVVYLNPSGPDAPVKIADKPLVDVGFDKVDRKSPLLRWTGIEDAYIATARRLTPGPGDRVVGASDEGALMIDGRRGGARFVALGFDPRDSDVVLRAAWPVFVLNLLNELASDDASYLSSFRTGEVWRVPVAPELDAVTIIGPRGDARRVPVKDGRAVLLGTDAGFYTVRGGPAGAEVETRFAANLADPDESAIAPRATLDLEGKRAEPPSGFVVGVRKEWWIYLLLAAVALTTLEWATYHRRLTV